MSTQLEALLDHTRDALIAGDISNLAALAEQVEALVADLPQLDRPAAERLNQKANRNARLLQAAQRGVRAARQRVIEIQAGPALSTYDARGRREVIEGPSPLRPHRV